MLPKSEKKKAVNGKGKSGTTFKATAKDPIVIEDGNDLEE